MDETNNQNNHEEQNNIGSKKLPNDDGPDFASVVNLDHNKLWPILGYIIPVLFFVPLVSDEIKSDKFARFHANQQLILLVIWILGWILTSIAIGMLINAFAFILAIIGIVNAVGNKMKTLPLVGGLNLIK